MRRGELTSPPELIEHVAALEAPPPALPFPPDLVVLRTKLVNETLKYNTLLTHFQKACVALENKLDQETNEAVNTAMRQVLHKIGPDPQGVTLRTIHRMRQRYELNLSEDSASIQTPSPAPSVLPISVMGKSARHLLAQVPPRPLNFDFSARDKETYGGFYLGLKKKSNHALAVLRRSWIVTLEMTERLKELDKLLKAAEGAFELVHSAREMRAHAGPGPLAHHGDSDKLPDYLPEDVLTAYQVAYAAAMAVLSQRWEEHERIARDPYAMEPEKLRMGFKIFGPKEHKRPRPVRIGINVIGVNEINDLMHYFEANLLLHTEWDASPIDLSGNPWRPWMQVHNARQVYAIENEGMGHYSANELKARVAHIQQQNPWSTEAMIYESRNMVAKFVNEMRLHMYPFDHQEFKITLVVDDKDTVDLQAMQGKTRYTHYYPTIKCRLEDAPTSDFSILMHDGTWNHKSWRKEGADKRPPKLAMTYYTIRTHDERHSPMGSKYQRLDFFMMAKRNVASVFVSIILPSLVLSGSSLCVWSMPLAQEGNESGRLQVLVTLILTLIANQIVTHGRLPQLSYPTYIDTVLLSYQAFVYFIIIVSSCGGIDSCAAIAGSVRQFDDATFTAAWSLFIIMNAWHLLSAYRLNMHAAKRVKAFIEKCDECLEKQQLAHLGRHLELSEKERIVEDDKEQDCKDSEDETSSIFDCVGRVTGLGACLVC